MPLRLVKDKPSRKGRSFRNTRRENRLEELGRVDAEKAYTSKGKRNLREEKSRIRSELATGGSIGKLKQTERKAGTPATRPMPPEQKRRPKAGKGMGPSAGGRRKKFKTHGGGPDSGNIGKFKDMLSKHKKMPKLPKQPSPKDLQRLKEKMPKYMKPLRKGGSAKKPRPHGPHMWVRGDKRKKYAAGSIVKGAIKGAKKIAKGLGSGIKPSEAKEILKTPGKSWKKTRSQYLKEHSPHFGGTRKKYASGGVVMAGKKVGCQIK